MRGVHASGGGSGVVVEGYSGEGKCKGRAGRRDESGGGGFGGWRCEEGKNKMGEHTVAQEFGVRVPIVPWHQENDRALPRTCPDSAPGSVSRRVLRTALGAGIHYPSQAN